MNTLIPKTLFLTLFIPAAFAENNDYPPAGSYGFDWLDPLSAQCRQITGADIRSFKSCYFEKEGGSFGLEYPYYSCRVNDEIEFVVYLSESACIEAKETMDANAL